MSTTHYGLIGTTLFMRSVHILALLLLFSIIPASSAERQLLRHHVPAAVTNATPLGRSPHWDRLDLTIGLPLRNQKALSVLLDQLYDPASTNYHRYLTPQQFAERFGPTEEDYQAVIQFAQRNGLRVTGQHPNRTLVEVKGALASIERAFHVHLRTYQHPTENRIFFAPDEEPSVELAVPILAVSGL